MSRRLLFIALIILFSSVSPNVSASDERIPVNVYIDSEPRVFYVSPNATVADVVEILREHFGIRYNHLHFLSQPVNSNSELIFFSNSSNFVSTTEFVRPDIDIILTDELYIGQVEIIEIGRQGITDIIYNYAYENGIQQRDIFSSRVVEWPVKRIERHGIKPLQAFSAQVFSAPRDETDEIPVDYITKITMSASGYSLDPRSTGKSPGHPAYGLTSTGVRAERGVVAVDPNFIPLGTKMYIVGYGYAVANDTGSAIKNNKIDLFFETHAEALEIGRIDVTVYIIEYP